MSKFKTILDLFTQDPAIQIHDTLLLITEPGDHRHKEHYQVAEIVVFPTKGLFTTYELNDFMRDMKRKLYKQNVHEIGTDSFRETEHDLYLGRLIFGEDIGTEEKTLTINDPEMQSQDGFENGVKKSTRTLHRHISIEVMPDAVTAALKYRSTGVVVNGPVDWNVSGSSIDWDVIRSIQDGATVLAPNSTVPETVPA